ncbi:MAG: methyltransferase domain-containing protein [Pseudomonadota bacterium]
MHKNSRFALAILALALSSAFAATSAATDAATAAAYKAAIASPARTDDDRKGDAKRKPAEFLEFAHVRPGMKVLDMVAGAGSTSELLALAVGSSGEVWAQSGKESPKLLARLAANPQPNLHPLVAPFEKPTPAGAQLDLVTLNMNYHDIVNTPADRTAMNKSIYDALKPGGYFVIIDNAAKDGSGLTATNTLHRIDEKAVIDEVTKAGFVVDGKGDFLRVPADPRDQPFFKMDGKPDDKFALRFVKK